MKKLTAKERREVLRVHAAISGGGGRTSRIAVIRARKDGNAEVLVSVAKKGYEPKFVCDWIVGNENYVIRDMDYCGMAGYQIAWNPQPEIVDSKTPVYGYRYEWSKDYKCRYIAGEGPFYCHAIVGIENLQKTRYKYHGYKNGSWMTIAEYLYWLNKEPRAEILMKSGLWQLIGKKPLKDMANDKRIMSYIARHKDDIVRYCFDYEMKDGGFVRMRRTIPWNELKKSARADEPFERLTERTEANSLFSKLDKRIDRIAAYHWCNKHEVSPCNYIMYIENAIECNARIDAYGIMFPRDAKTLAERNEGYIQRIRAREERKRKALAMEEKRNASRLIASAKRIARSIAKGLDIASGYSIVIPTTEDELVAEGIKMHNCVGRYYEDIVDGTSLIVFITDTKTGEKYDIEIRGKDRKEPYIQQCYAKNNQDAGKNAWNAAMSILEFVKSGWNKRVRTAKKEVA